MVNLNECNGSRNTLYDTSSRIFVPNKTEDVYLNVLNVFNIIPKINGSKTSKELVSCDCKCKLDSTKYKSNQNWNKDKC